MDLYGGAPFWLLQDGIGVEDDPLPDMVDVCVIGSGITGALVSHNLVRSGLSVAVVDKRSATTGSTVASTALLMYELDTELNALIKMIGRERARRAYRRVSVAIEDLATLCATLDENVAFRQCDSLYLASRLSHLMRLREETSLLQDAGLDARWLSAAKVRSEWGLPGHGAIHSSMAADVDPVLLSRCALRRARSLGATVTTDAPVISIAQEHQRVRVTTQRGSVSAKWCVSAMGYETPPGITPPMVTLHSSYAFVTEPMTQLGPLNKRTLLWESNRPYFYARTTADNRLMVGGAYIPFKDPVKRDSVMEARQEILERNARAWLPGVDFKVAMAWSGTFAETADGLPCIGPLQEMPQVILALAAGGNGIPFAMIAAQLVTAHCQNVMDADADLFSPDRLQPWHWKQRAMWG